MRRNAARPFLLPRFLLGLRESEIPRLRHPGGAGCRVARCGRDGEFTFLACRRAGVA